MEFIKKDKTYNYDNVIQDTITTFAADLSLIPSERSRREIAELIKIQIGENF